jgi:hypothetical protein
MRAMLAMVLTCFLAGCASPEVDRAGANFDEERFVFDLDRCRGGTFIEASAKSVGIAAIGSAWGAVHGVSVGIGSGNGWEGAAIGAVVGGTVGLGIGAAEAIDKYNDEVFGCLRAKGYELRS